MKCQYCPRRLRTKESKDRGYGYICGRKNGLIPPPIPRSRRPPALTTPKPRTTAPATAPDIHPDQMTIPIQTEVQED